jgi:hypothetical protein
MKIKSLFLLLFCLFAFSDATLAQQYWLQPDTFLVNRKQSVNLKIAAGDSLENTGNPNKTQVLRFTLFDKKDSLNVTNSFSGSATIPGTQIGNRTLVVAKLKLPDADLMHNLFRNEFTREQKAMLKSLDTAILRSNIPTEHLIFAKTLLSDGSKTGSEVHKKMIDLPLEILVLLDPFTLTPGKVLPIQLIYDRKVMAFKTYSVYHKDLKGNVKKYIAKTSKAGAGSFTIKGPGHYLIAVNQTGPLPTPNPEEVKWQQLEATYLFYIADPNPKAATTKKK